MTTSGLRALLERVEERDGPVWPMGGAVVGRYGSKGQVLTASLERAANDLTTQDGIVGVLKRDLIERGMRYSILGGPDNFAVTVFRSSLDDKKHGGWATNLLEAVLKAWLAAAEAEGWAA